MALVRAPPVTLSTRAPDHYVQRVRGPQPSGTTQGSSPSACLEETRSRSDCLPFCVLPIAWRREQVVRHRHQAAKRGQVVEAVNCVVGGLCRGGKPERRASERPAPAARRLLSPIPLNGAFSPSSCRPSARRRSSLALLDAAASRPVGPAAGGVGVAGGGGVAIAGGTRCRELEARDRVREGSPPASEKVSSGDQVPVVDREAATRSR